MRKFSTLYVGVDVHKDSIEVTRAQGAHRALDGFNADLVDDLKDLREFEYRAREVVDRMALAQQASLLVRDAPTFVSDAFCISRLTQWVITTTAPCRAALISQPSMLAPHRCELRGVA